MSPPCKKMRCSIYTVLHFSGLKRVVNLKREQSQCHGKRFFVYQKCKQDELTYVYENNKHKSKFNVYKYDKHPYNQ